MPLIPDTGNRTLEFPEGVPVADTQNMTNGNTAPLFVLGGGQNDRFEVNYNRGKLYLHGGDGNDRFLLKTFLVLKENPDDPEEITNLANLFGGTGSNRYDYLQNAPVFINGGTGIDTIVVVGTPIGDTFVVTDTYVAGAGRIVTFAAIEAVEVDGAGGDDQIYVLSTGDAVRDRRSPAAPATTRSTSAATPPTLVFDPPPFTYTPPAFTVHAAARGGLRAHFYDLTAFTFTVSLFEWLARGGLRPTGAGSQAAGNVARAELRRPGPAALARIYRYLQVDAPASAAITARLRYDIFFAFLFDPRVEVTIGNFELRTGSGTLEPRPS